MHAAFHDVRLDAVAVEFDFMEKSRPWRHGFAQRRKLRLDEAWIGGGFRALDNAGFEACVRAGWSHLDRYNLKNVT